MKKTATVKLPKSDSENYVLSYEEEKAREKAMSKLNHAELEKIDKFYYYDADDTGGAGYGIGFIGEKLISFKYSDRSKLRFEEIGLPEAIENLLEMKSAEELIESFCSQSDGEGEVKFFRLLQSSLK